MNHFGDARCGPGRILVLPDPDRYPPRLAKTCICVTVPRYVRLYFFAPPVRIRRRPRHVMWAPVPKTPVYKDCDAKPVEQDVCSPSHARKRRPVDAISKAQPMQFTP